MKIDRSSGILLHITSLPGKYGIGTMGEEAFNFVDFLVESGQRLWQILPLGHTGYGDSPYQCFSAFAGNPLLIDLDKLIKEGYLSKDDMPDNSKFPEEEVDYGAVTNYKPIVLNVAFENFLHNNKKVDKIRFENFCNKNKAWLEDYALYMAIKDSFQGRAWTEWDEDIKLRRQHAMDKYRHDHSKRIMYYKFIQFIFYKQWLELKTYANISDIQIIGDIPIYVAFDGADAWSKSEMFDFDDLMNPRTVAGVPPDYFSETGQLWGNPIYNWKKMSEDGYQWWIDRIEANFKLYDILRIDHFRGLAAYWAVPFGNETAEHGKWVKAPGEEMLEAVHKDLGDLQIIAENLGVITPDVEELREKFNLPGMKILQFAFDSGEENDFIPHTYDKSCVVYTGTHDNDTTLGRFKASTEEEKKYMRDYFRIDEKDPAWSFIRLAWSTVAEIAIAPLQDVLRLDTEARMNFPGKASGYWKWRYKKDMLTKQDAEDLLKLTNIFGRR
ncbi:MAG: 4-alpha-glucanotransferase [Bacteroidota bacterium]